MPKSKPPHPDPIWQAVPQGAAEPKEITDQP
jgi:hypothetical protein